MELRPSPARRYERHRSDRIQAMTTTRSKPVSDSAWFWVLLFGSMGLAMLATIEPKFAKRYERLERMHQARTQAALRSATGRSAVGGSAASDGHSQFEANDE